MTTITQPPTPVNNFDSDSGRQREMHYMAHHVTSYTRDDKIAAAELLREAGYVFHWQYTNSCGQDIGYWSNSRDTWPSTHEYYDHALATIALHTDITPEQIKARAARNRRTVWIR